jgi:hypothetical protein
MTDFSEFVDVGEWDGAGAVVKRALRNEQLQHPERQMQNTTHCIEFLNSHFSSRVSNSYAKSTTDDCDRTFWHIDLEDINRDDPWGCNTLPGSRSLHSVMGNSIGDPTCFLVRELSCFYLYCVEKDWANFDRKTHVKLWFVVRLRPHNAQRVIQQIDLQNDPDDWEFDGCTEAPGDLVEVGDNFAVPTPPGNEEGVEFFVLQCQRKKYEVQVDFEFPWGGEFKRGDFVVSGTYYKKFGRGDNTYVYLDKAVVAHVDSHLIRACKISHDPSMSSSKGR